jgi:predicted transcriptional regulator
MRTSKKLILIQSYIDQRVNQEFKPSDIADAVECTVQLVYGFMRDNSERFTKVKRGVYKINPSNQQAFLKNQSTI